jgi:hypothetical protein
MPIVNNWAYRVGLGYGNSKLDIEDVIRDQMPNMIPFLYEKYKELAGNYNANKFSSETGWYMVHMVAEMFFREHKLPFYTDHFSSRFYEKFYTILEDKPFLQHVNDEYENIFNENSNVSSQAKIETCMILSVLYSNNMGQLNKMISDYIAVFDNNEALNKFISDFSYFITFKERSSFDKITKDIYIKDIRQKIKQQTSPSPPITRSKALTLALAFTPPVEKPELKEEEEVTQTTNELETITTPTTTEPEPEPDKQQTLETFDSNAE